jgi:ArsR family transcriptional regulator, arsenate/arsenite/antimonite-responsive transcriptional repressor / arsenate reductase (thioredoxin)
MSVAAGPPEILPLIADPHRWHLLAELSQSDRRVSELCELVGEPQNLVSYHLGELRRAGIVTSRRSSADGRDVYYRAELTRCRDLLGAAGSALHPGLRLAAPPPDATPSSGRQPRVLFLCTGNSARSQIAEALLEARSDRRFRARSAGSRPKPLHPNAVKVMADRGIDIADRPTKHLRRFARMRFDRVVTLCDKVREICPEFPGAPVTAHWSIADPAAEGDNHYETLPAFERVADELEGRVALLIAELTVRSAERTTHAR